MRLTLIAVIVSAAVLLSLTQAVQIKTGLLQQSAGANPATPPQAAAAAPPPANRTANHTSTANTTANSTTKPPQAAAPVSTGTILVKYGAFCGPKSHHCVAFCQKPTG